jgi:hypothetical protein
MCPPSRFPFPSCGVAVLLSVVRVVTFSKLRKEEITKYYDIKDKLGTYVMGPAPSPPPSVFTSSWQYPPLRSRCDATYGEWTWRCIGVRSRR